MHLGAWRGHPVALATLPRSLVPPALPRTRACCALSNQQQQEQQQHSLLLRTPAAAAAATLTLETSRGNANGHVSPHAAAAAHAPEILVHAEAAEAAAAASGIQLHPSSSLPPLLMHTPPAPRPRPPALLERPAVQAGDDPGQPSTSGRGSSSSSSSSGGSGSASNRPSLTGRITPARLSALSRALHAPVPRIQRLLELSPGPLLALSPESELPARLDELQTELGLGSRKQVAAVARAQPSLVLRKGQQSGCGGVGRGELGRRLGLLAQGLGVGREEVARAAVAVPALLRQRPEVVVKRLERLSSLLGLRSPGQALRTVAAAPQYLTASYRRLERRLADACKALGRPLPQVQAMVTREPDLLLLGARIFNNRLKILQCILDKKFHHLVTLVVKCPRLLVCDMDGARLTFEGLIRLLNVTEGVVYAMVCHAPQLLTVPLVTLARRRRLLSRALALCPSWDQQWRGLNPAKRADVLLASTTTFLRLEFLLIIQQAPSMQLVDVLRMARVDFSRRWPGFELALARRAGRGSGQQQAQQQTQQQGRQQGHQQAQQTQQQGHQQGHQQGQQHAPLVAQFDGTRDRSDSSSASSASLPGAQAAVSSSATAVPLLRPMRPGAAEGVLPNHAGQSSGQGGVDARAWGSGPGRPLQVVVGGAGNIDAVGGKVGGGGGQGSGRRQRRQPLTQQQREAWLLQRHRRRQQQRLEAGQQGRRRRQRGRRGQPQPQQTAQHPPGTYRLDVPYSDTSADDGQPWSTPAHGQGAGVDEQAGSAGTWDPVTYLEHQQALHSHANGHACGGTNGHAAGTVGAGACGPQAAGPRVDGIVQLTGTRDAVRA